MPSHIRARGLALSRSPCCIAGTAPRLAPASGRRKAKRKQADRTTAAYFFNVSEQRFVAIAFQVRARRFAHSLAARAASQGRLNRARGLASSPRVLAASQGWEQPNVLRMDVTLAALPVVEDPYPHRQPSLVFTRRQDLARFTFCTCRVDCDRRLEEG